MQYTYLPANEGTSFLLYLEPSAMQCLNLLDKGGQKWTIQLWRVSNPFDLA